MKRLVPSWVKKKIKMCLQNVAMRKGVGEIMALPVGMFPDRDLLDRLRKAWGNEGYSADLSYLMAVAQRAVSVEGPVLECGSGLTTILLGILVRRNGSEVWTLEHDVTWYNEIKKAIRKYKIPNINVVLSGLQSYGEFSWYTPTIDLMSKKFSLVICDGPPENTHGGRYGLLPIMQDQFDKDVVILLDDANRESEVEIIQRWEKKYGLSVSIVSHRDDGSYAVLSRGNQRKSK